MKIIFALLFLASAWCASQERNKNPINEHMQELAIDENGNGKINEFASDSITTIKKDMSSAEHFFASLPVDIFRYVYNLAVDGVHKDFIKYMPCVSKNIRIQIYRLRKVVKLSGSACLLRLPTVAEMFPSITTLTISLGYENDNEEFTSCLSKLALMSNLRILEISGSFQTDFSILSEALTNLSKLTELRLYNTNISDYSFLDNMPKLEVVDITADGKLKNVNFLSKLSNLKIVDMRNLEIEQPIDDLEFLSKSHYLEKFIIPNLKVSAANVTLNLPHLGTLELQEGPFFNLSINKRFELSLYSENKKRTTHAIWHA